MPCDSNGIRAAPGTVDAGMNATQAAQRIADLVPHRAAGHIRAMRLASYWRALERNPSFRYALFLLGCLLLILTPFVGVVPGPGGVVVFAAGLGLVLKNSLWAKRRYVLFKRRWPKPGHWCDWGMRRQSALRRKAIERERDAAAD
ncbi:MAG: hypothetical protein JWM38_2104 [Sphingomonas bacterium]|nr:hypothetical protein [Sphingomonas bacterium]MDB5682491.1 hypothetical protein [Sphingomonas bacterium]MDB5718677.1 hypothetical protein [Sphingomonas bacterium]